jgi:hypothetical protein
VKYGTPIALIINEYEAIQVKLGWKMDSNNNLTACQTINYDASLTQGCVTDEMVSFIIKQWSED